MRNSQNLVPRSCNCDVGRIILLRNGVAIRYITHVTLSYLRYLGYVTLEYYIVLVVATPVVWDASRPCCHANQISSCVAAVVGIMLAAVVWELDQQLCSSCSMGIMSAAVVWESGQQLCSSCSMGIS